MKSEWEVGGVEKWNFLEGIVVLGVVFVEDCEGFGDVEGELVLGWESLEVEVLVINNDGEFKNDRVIEDDFLGEEEDVGVCEMC